MISGKRWLLKFILSVAVVTVPTACYFFESCPDVLPYFSIRGLNVTNLSYTGQGSNPWKVVTTNEPVKRDSFFMRISFEQVFHASARHSGGANLYALSCDPPGYGGSLTGVDTLYIVTQQDYTPQYLKNDTINAIAGVNYWTMYGDDFNEFFTLSDFIRENSEGIAREYFEIKFTEPPSANGDFRFRIIFILQNGDKFEAVSDKVSLI